MYVFDESSTFSLILYIWKILQNDGMEVSKYLHSPKICGFRSSQILHLVDFQFLFNNVKTLLKVDICDEDYNVIIRLCSAHESFFIQYLYLKMCKQEK